MGVLLVLPTLAAGEASLSATVPEKLFHDAVLRGDRFRAVIDESLANAAGGTGAGRCGSRAGAGHCPTSRLGSRRCTGISPIPRAMTHGVRRELQQPDRRQDDPAEPKPWPQTVAIAQRRASRHMLGSCSS